MAWFESFFSSAISRLWKKRLIAPSICCTWMEENWFASDIALKHRVEVATAVVPRSYGTDLQTCGVVLWVVII
jgi:hypothetical protein